MSTSRRSIETLFEDASILVINKPAGLPSTSRTLADESCETWFRNHIARDAGGPIHRLDNGTSGALAFAKTDQALAQLRALWSQPGRVLKIYRALTASPPPQDVRSLDFSIGHSGKSAKKMIGLQNLNSVALRSIRGKPQDAHTQILAVAPTGREHFDLTLQITTGVRHQIRIHLSMVGSPILGDVLYKGAPAERLFLHAWKLRLPDLPEVIAPMPEEWET